MTTGYDWNFSVLLEPENRRVLLNGLNVTLRLTGYCIAVGTPMGAVLGMGMAGGLPGERHPEPLNWARPLLAFAVDIVRAIPLLLLILLSYYWLPAVVPETWNVTGFQSAAIAMAVNLSAFVADVVRSAAEAVPRGSILAGRAIGMSRLAIWQRIALPEIMRQTLPALTVLYITMLKLSTLASVVAVYELLHSADMLISETYKTLEFYVAIMVIFILIVVPLSWFARWLEGRPAFKRRS